MKTLGEILVTLPLDMNSGDYVILAPADRPNGEQVCVLQGHPDWAIAAITHLLCQMETQHIDQIMQSVADNVVERMRKAMAEETEPEESMVNALARQKILQEMENEG